MMKRKVVLAALITGACLMTGCSSGKKETEAPTKAETEAAKTEETEAAAEEAAEAAAEAATEAAETVEETVTEAAEAATEAAETVEETVTEAVETVEETATEAAETVEEAATEAAAALEEALSEAEEVLETELVEAAVVDIAGVAAETELPEESAEEETEAAEAAVAEEIVEDVTEAAEAAAVEEIAEEETEAAEAAAVEEIAEEETEAADEIAVEEIVEEKGTETALEELEELGTEASTEAEGMQMVDLGERPTYTAADYVTVGTYKGLMAEVTEIVITDDDVDGELDLDVEMAVEEKQLYDKITDGTIADGDVVNIDYEGKVDGVAFDGGTGTYDLEIGSGSFIEGFEEQLIGAKVGETIDINVTFPEDYYEELAGQDAVFTVTPNYIRKNPEVTDELISKMTDGEYTTIEAYREHEREELAQQAQETQDGEVNNELMTQLYNTMTVNSYPEDLVNYSIDEAHNYYIQMSQMYGMTYEDMIAMSGMDEESFESYLKDMVESSLKQELILHAIAEEENMTISEEEYKAGVENFANMYGAASVEEFEASFSRQEIEEALLMNKVQDFVRENAIITEVEPETEDLELLLEDESEVFDDEDELVYIEEDDTEDIFVDVEEEETETETETEL